MKALIAASAALLMLLPSPSASAHPAFRNVTIPAFPAGGAYKCSVYVTTGGPNNTPDKDKYTYHVSLSRSESQWPEPATGSSNGNWFLSEWSGYYWWTAFRWVEQADANRIPSTVTVKLGAPPDCIAAFSYTTKAKPINPTGTAVTLKITLPTGFTSVNPAPYIVVMDGREAKSLDKAVFTLSSQAVSGAVVTLSVVGLYAGRPQILPLELVLKIK